MKYHKLLQRQIKNLSSQYLEDETIRKILAKVSNSYMTFERDKMISEHAFTVGEKEYQALTKFLKQQNDIREQSIAWLKEAGITVLVIAHRPSLLGGMDKILVLREGMVESFGPRADIMSRVTRVAA